VGDRLPVSHLGRRFSLDADTAGIAGMDRGAGGFPVPYLLVPLVNALTTTRGLVASLVAGDAVFAGFDLMMLASSGLPAFSAWSLATRTQDRGFAGAIAR
jgi:hypothetical protein